MNLPIRIINKIMELSYSENKKELSKDFRRISDKYMGEKNGESLLNEPNEVLAYSITRMPATYCAVWSAFNHVLEIIETDEVKNDETKTDGIKTNEIKTLIDVGAGTGAATLAIANQINLENIICIEREKAMINIGKELLKEEESLPNIIWKNADICENVAVNENTDMCENTNVYKNTDICEDANVNENADMQKSVKQGDIVVASYILNELSEDMLMKVVSKLWNMTSQILLIVEPGTPADYKEMMKIKEYLISQGANIIAPCTSASECKIKDDDWCNFTCRVERTKLQKNIKNADVPYEDEKYTYLAFSRKKYDLPSSRIIRSPIIKTNMVKLKLCEDGEIVEKVFTKNDKEIYKRAKKLKTGDVL